MASFGLRCSHGGAIGLSLVAVWMLVAQQAAAEPPAVFDGRPTLNVVYETTSNPPRHLGEGTAIDWDRPGMTLELLKRVGGRLQINMSFKRVPWKRGLLMLETGEADGIFHSSFVAEREAIGVYPKDPDGRPDASRSLFHQSYALFVVPDSTVTWDGTTIDGLGGRPIGATAGYSVIADLERMGVVVVPGRFPALNLSKLLEGRIAAYAELETMAAELIRRDPQFAQVVKLQPPLITKPYYLMLSRPFVQGDRALAEAVWNTIAEVRESKEFLALGDRYTNGG